MANQSISDKDKLEEVVIEGETFFKISHCDAMRPFFMSIVSDSNHWMFISSNGGLTAGRKNAESALFPYYTDDKITEATETTGCKTLIRVKTGEGFRLWEPFSDFCKDHYQVQRNLYKNRYGNKIRFEEINKDLGLTFCYSWSSSNLYGFVRDVEIKNNTSETVELEVLDGVQNIVPFGVGSELQNRYSNLADAYKRSELLEGSGVGIYALSAIIVDKAEPSEALKASIFWSLDTRNPTYLLSSTQLPSFRRGMALKGETDVKAEKGGYFVHQNSVLGAQAKKTWKLIGNVNQDHASIVKISEAIKNDVNLVQKVDEDVASGTKRLVALTASADGLQASADMLVDSRHFSNTMFNIMRGGIFDKGYQIEKKDFIDYLAKANKAVFHKDQVSLQRLPEEFSLSQFNQLLEDGNDSDLERLAKEYLPLKFSRRHGDPSRPWNQFSINTQSEVDGSKILDYQGNWRDIFQNWEALAHSYPAFIEGMICKFLNASTFDGYNPYRVVKDGFDWEVIEPDDPWSYIGYWGDHQIIYLLKFLEFAENHYPGKLQDYFTKDVFVYANVPYKIKEYASILKNPKDTISFDHELDGQIRERRNALGADGALLSLKDGTVHKVNFIEKILATVLAKVSNFIPEGGIWMNTQRPEWNDANNALVGNGVSMVTLYYLHRFLKFLHGLLDTGSLGVVAVSEELKDFFTGIANVLDTHKNHLDTVFSDKDRKKVLDGLGMVASDYREKIYDSSFSGKKKNITIGGLKRFTQLALSYLEQSIKANRRDDGLYHAYNLMTVDGDGVAISYLSEMLEGQVAVLSSKFLSPTGALEVLDALKASALFREDQYSYILYPNKDLPRFQEKNTMAKEAISGSKLAQELLEKGDNSVLSKDVLGNIHFNGNFNNAYDLRAALGNKEISNFQHASEAEKNQLLQLFEEVFNHKAFTGRSGTFFGYEGLGSIYWHMVSKLLLAVQECCLEAMAVRDKDEIIGRLMEHYYEINAGIGIHKPPSLYGAFPTDPYSHTPAGKGAQQPGMTGQVKEDILARFGELGVRVKDGNISFEPSLLRKDEFLTQKKKFHYVDVKGAHRDIDLEPGSLAFTYCQTPIIYTLSDRMEITVLHNDGSTTLLRENHLGRDLSERLFIRKGELVQLTVLLKK